jgi:hypothetical protein
MFKHLTPKTFIFFFSTFCLIGFYSCERIKENTSTTSSVDNSMAEALFNDVFSLVDENVKCSASASSNNNDTCSDITTTMLDSASMHRLISIDFGDGCQCSDGRTRSGIINIEIDGNYLTPGTKTTINLQNYHVNGSKVEGQKEITHLTSGSSNNPSFKVKVISGQITQTDNSVINWESERTNEWIEGSTTPDYIWDDVYHIYGGSSGINSQGRAYTVTITDQLEKAMGCRWVKDGVIQLQPENLNTRNIDFGDGTCDNDAVVSIGNKSFNIKLF